MANREYKINRLKMPNQIGRTYYNYVQIGNSENIGYANTNSAVPSDDMEKIISKIIAL